MYLYDRRAGGGGTREERVHLFPSGHVSTELERFDGEEGLREGRLSERRGGAPPRTLPLDHRILGCASPRGQLARAITTSQSTAEFISAIAAA